mmetsp:Transcript_26790/g.33378  ORF Transcript_26790/g.33378 Transcript_26790/m.33378 type:complete len:87 (+) Transcript_26790:1893-2153(+)
MGIHTQLLDCEEEAELTRPHRFAYDSILMPASSLGLREQQSEDVLSNDGAAGATVRPAFASFVEPESANLNDSDSLCIEFKEDIND